MKQEFTFVQEFTENSKHAGNKARKDIDTILSEMQFYPVFYYDRKPFCSIVDKIKYVLNLDNIYRFLSVFSVKDKRIFLQYPFYCNSLIKKLILRLIKKNYIGLFIHDVDSLRSIDTLPLVDEVAIMNSCKVIVVHNKYMATALGEIGVEKPMIILELFDYLRESKEHKLRVFDNVISFAGNLAKSTFLCQDLTNIKVKFFLYGVNYRANKIVSSNVEYQGSYMPDEIPYQLKGSFGLIWDGDSIDTCSGSFGEYTRYNNPHKLSLYISSCLPVIVWSQAAIADFVKEQDIGFCVDKLSDINTVLDSMTEEDYARYLKNITALQEKVISGYFTKKAIRKAMDLM